MAKRKKKKTKAKEVTNIRPILEIAAPIITILSAILELIL